MITYNYVINKQDSTNSNDATTKDLCSWEDNV